MSSPTSGPSPTLFFETINGHVRTAALKAAIELDVFTAVGEGNQSAERVAARCSVSERGARILCDYLTIMGFLVKQGGGYALAPDSAPFVDRRSPAYMGGVLEFILSPAIVGSFDDLAAAVRKGGTVLSEEGTMAPEHPVWVKFARAMVPMMAMPAQMVAKILELPAGGKIKILDIAAGHGIYGIALAQGNAAVELTAQDWPSVLEVAQQNARKAGLADRFKTLPGSAFEVDFGTGYDLVLLANFLHHFDADTCVGMLRKVHAALAPGGRAVTVEFVPNDDRVSPPPSAGFAMMMLATTARGDAYTFAELDEMARRAGFASSEIHPMPPSAWSTVISRKV